MMPGVASLMLAVGRRIELDACWLGANWWLAESSVALSFAPGKPPPLWLDTSTLCFDPRTILAGRVPRSRLQTADRRSRRYGVRHVGRPQSLYGGDGVTSPGGVSDLRPVVFHTASVARFTPTVEYRVAPARYVCDWLITPGLLK